jgi:carbon-monoxide dehydrogenase large subunit
MVSLLSLVGASLASPDGKAKATGRAHYTADRHLEDALFAVCLRSPHPHARIVSIDANDARSLPGVAAVLTGRDLPAGNWGRRVFDMPVLATDRVRFAGERVAVVAADDPGVAAEACRLITVEYEELPAVFDELDAIRDGAPLVHGESLSYQGYVEPPPPIPNAYSLTASTIGDIAAGFEAADVVVEHTFRTPSQHHAYLEPHATTVQVTESGKTNAWLTNKTPHTARQQLAFLLGLPEEDVIVHMSHIGGDFGGKGSIMDAPLCYHLALATRRPVSMVMDYFDELTAANPRHPSTIRIKAGVMNDGQIVAWDMRTIFNTGAYAAFLPGGRLGGARSGPYEIPNVYAESMCVYTNCTPRGHMRAPGSPQTTFAIESMLDVIAADLGMDPVTVRLRNLGGKPRARELIERAASAAGLFERRPEHSGRGVSFFSHGTGTGQANVRLRIDKGGVVDVYAAAPDTGTGAHTILTQIVAQELAVDPATVRIVSGDTGETEPDSGVGGSRVSHVYGQAALAAAQQARSLLLGHAAELMETPPGALCLEDGVIRRTSEGARSGLGIGAIVAAAYPGTCLEVSHTFIAPRRQPGSQSGSDEDIAYCAQIAEVEIDPDTGSVRLKRFVTAHDVGTILNPIAHQGQINGGVIQGIGFALTEELVIDSGRVVNPHFGAYKIPSIEDLPILETLLVPSAGGLIPHAGKAIGEVANCPVAPAIANAVFDAVGARIATLPITAEKIYLALNAAEAGLEQPSEELPDVTQR